MEEIMAKKQLKAKKRNHGDCHTLYPEIASEIAYRIRQDALLGAAFMALSVNDLFALDILCSHLLNNRNICAPDTGCTGLIQLHSEIVFHDSNLIYYNGNTLLHHAAEQGLLEIVKTLSTKPDHINKQNKYGCARTW